MELTIKSLFFIPIFLAAFGYLGIQLKGIIDRIKIGTPENRFDRVPERLYNVLQIAFGQSKLLREPIAGVLHFFIFWGFVLFIFAVLEAIIQGFYANFTLEIFGGFYTLVTVTQDIFGLLVFIAVLFSLYRRFIQKVPRLQVEKHSQMEAALILSLIMLVVLSMFGQNMAHVAKNNFILSEYEIRPFTYTLSSLFYNSGSTAANVSFEVFWWIHILVIFVFMNLLPSSKHLHIITSIPNVFFAKLDEEKNILKPINLDDESVEYYGVDDIDKFSWKQILDGFSCTECGRCTSVCPAANSGKSLSPKKIIVDIRKRANEKAPLILAGENGNEKFDNTLVHNFISDTELWQCTTCMACVQECPVMIEHVESIVDMRRHLVLTESNFPSELNNVFKSLETNGSPWAFNQADRALWADGLNIKTMAEDSDCEYLFWVGCAGSYDDRYKKVSRAFAQIMQKADVDFRILGTEEVCNGDTARRLGNEYLAQELMKQNIETLNNYKVKKIVTACPHCFNSLGKEFKQFGGDYDVVHHTDMINDLLKKGKISLKSNSVKNKITYHDSCYLGRYNDIYDSPRQSLSNIDGVELVEMERNKSKGFCCGAGGGRMFLEDVEGGRINEERTKEALSTTADTIGTACPFCMTMMSDGVKSFNKTDDVAVKDIAEIVFENLQ